MTDSDWAALALPRLAPIEDPDTYLQTALRWHFGPDTGSPYWLERAKSLDFDPLTEVKSFADLTLFPNIVDELRDVPVEDLVPAGYGANPPSTIWESGGTTGAPKRVVAPWDWVQQLGMWLVEELDETCHSWKRSTVRRPERPAHVRPDPTLRRQLHGHATVLHRSGSALGQEAGRARRLR